MNGVEKMNNKILPIGSVIEFEGNKLIIIQYEDDSYVCAGYPTYYLMDLIPSNKVKEYKSKYNNYDTDNNVRFDADYKVICEGYRNGAFEEFVKNM